MKELQLTLKKETVEILENRRVHGGADSELSKPPESVKTTCLKPYTVDVVSECVFCTDFYRICTTHTTLIDSFCGFCRLESEQEKCYVNEIHFNR